MTDSRARWPSQFAKHADRAVAHKGREEAEDRRLLRFSAQDSPKVVSRALAA